MAQQIKPNNTSKIKSLQINFVKIVTKLSKMHLNSLPHHSKFQIESSLILQREHSIFLLEFKLIMQYLCKLLGMHLFLFRIHIFQQLGTPSSIVWREHSIFLLEFKTIMQYLIFYCKNILPISQVELCNIFANGLALSLFTIDLFLCLKSTPLQ